MIHKASRFRHALFSITGALLLVLLPMNSVSAHITAKADTTEAGHYAILTFTVPHGCEGSATTEVTISIPEEVTSVTPGVNSGWTIDVVRDEGENSTDHGRISEVTYTAHEPLPNDYFDQLRVQVVLPADAAGSTLYFPTIQTCEEGEIAWIQIPGDDNTDLPNPAPSITITDATTEGHGH